MRLGCTEVPFLAVFWMIGRPERGVEAGSWRVGSSTHFGWLGALPMIGAADGSVFSYLLAEWTLTFDNAFVTTSLESRCFEQTRFSLFLWAVGARFMQRVMLPPIFS